MKRLISLLVTIAMLAAMTISASAQLPSVKEYILDDASDVGHYVPSPIFNGFRSGTGLPGKEGGSVYQISNNASDMQLRFTPPAHTSYADGEKVHLSAEIMIPSGSFAAARQPYAAPGINLAVNTPDGAQGIAVKNGGHKDTKANTRNLILGFNTYSNRFILFGNSVYTDTKWEYDQWYRVDIVLVMGTSPKAAIYVDGDPLTINPDHKSGTPYHKDNYDATFDGYKTSSDYVEIGYRDGSLNYKEMTMTGVSYFYPLTASFGNGDVNTMFADNMFYKALSADEKPEIPEALSLAGINDGATLLYDDLKSLDVNLPLWIEEGTAKVTLSVDGEVFEDASAPYTFDIRGIDRGVKNITITAYDSSENVLKVANQTVTVAGNEKLTRVEETFDGAILEGDFYGLSTRKADCTASGGKIDITKEAITDSLGKDHGNSVKVLSKNQRVRYAWGPNQVGDWAQEWPAYTDGLVKVSYDMYLDNKNISELRFYHESDKGYQFAYWDSANQKFVTNNYWTGTTSSVYFDVDTKVWQKWDWTLDYDKGTVSLKIGDEIKLNKVAMSANAKNAGFSWWMFQFNSGSDEGNYIGIDNFKVEKENAISTIYADDFALEFSNAETYADATTKKAPIAYKTPVGTYKSNYGKTVIEYDYTLDNASHGAIRFKVHDVLFWQAPAGATTIKLDPWGSKTLSKGLATGVKQNHKIVIYPNPAAAYANVMFYIDGTLVYDGTCGYKYDIGNYAAPFVAWELTGAKDTADTTKFASNKLAVENISITYEPITPVIDSVTFADGLEKDGKVLASATGFTLNVSGMDINLADKVTVKELGTDVSLGTVSVSGNTVSVSDLALESGKTYVAEVASGVSYDLQGCTTKNNSTYVFEVVDEFEQAQIPDDGVEDDITVTDVRFTNSSDSIWTEPVHTYIGGNFEEGDVIRADITVNNNTMEKKTFRAIIATYYDNTLVDFSVGKDFVVNAGAKDTVITTGSVTVAQETNLKLKVMLVQDMDNMTPISVSYNFN